MEVDSAMSGESDHDPLVQTNSTNGPDPPAESQSPTAQQSNNDSVNSNSNSGGGGAVVVGPRCAPTYSLVNAIIEQKEDGPGPRCGHTLTAVTAVGEEGSPGYIGPRLILFGGATALEGNSGASGTPSSAGSAGISEIGLSDPKFECFYWSSEILGYLLIAFVRGGDCGFDVEEEVVVDLIIDSGGGGGGDGDGDGDGNGIGGDDCGDGGSHSKDLDNVNDIPIIDQFDSNDALGRASSCGDSGFGIDVHVVVTTTTWVVPRCTCKKLVRWQQCH
ncbi:Hypothetical predicted protein [Olea europaea subsp. europaea]|uniref:Uncharacterized protein n=1 Tax=Olea europaea subsp. europaea TaxID=158383 RepID=A0A8S0TCA9_OLEEU|nr:Hypothetical predicted protein [Olea europaea subsp. europaea]